MARNKMIIVALTFFVVLDSLADASIVLNFRKAISESTNSSAPAANLTQNSPVPIPVPGGKDSSSTAAKPEKDKNSKSSAMTHEKEKDFNPTAVKDEKDKHSNSTAAKPEKDNSTAAKPEKDKDLHNTTAKQQKEKPTDPGVTKNDNSSSKSVPINTGQHEGQEKRGGTIDSQLGSDVSCWGSTKKCNVLNTMAACVLPTEPGWCFQLLNGPTAIKLLRRKALLASIVVGRTW